MSRRSEGLGRALRHAQFPGKDSLRSQAKTATSSRVLLPEQHQVLQRVRFPVSLWDEVEPVTELLRRIDALIMRCLDLEDEYRFLLASFVMSTWMIDRLPVALYVALVGPPGSGTTASTILT